MKCTPQGARCCVLTAALLTLPLVLTGCGAGSTATQAVSEAQAAKAAQKDLDSAKAQINAVQQVQNQQLKQAKQQ
ncbi:MAG TPA: hypothetical protein PLD79_05370 [Halothiobacillus sp.]|nr:hypothetical protein [Halothiobacillus sp.]